MSIPTHNPNAGAEDEWVGEAFRRADRWYIAPPRTPMPDIGEEPGAPWIEVAPLLKGDDE